MSALASLNGITALSCRVNLPAWGVWWAEVEIDRPDPVSGPATIILGDLTLRGTVMSGGPWQGRARYRIAGGAGRWGRVIGAQSYANDLGVKLSTVIGDAARACGESIGIVPATTAGPAYARAEGPAARVLDELAPRGWYVDEAGFTQIGRRPSVVYAGGATRMKRDGAQGTLELAPTTIADLRPGVVVDGLEAVDVQHVLEGKLRTTIWGRGIADTSRIPDAFRRIVESFTAGHRYFAPWEYRVVQRTGERLDLQVVRVSTGMPDLQHVRVRPGVSGCRAHPQLGSLVLVSFVNGDPGRPVVTAFDDADSPGFVPNDLYLQAGGTGAQPTEHATSAEAMVLFVYQALAALATPLGGTAAVKGAISTALAAISGTLIAPPATLASVDVAPGATKLAIAAALAAKSADSAGDTPSIGWPNVRGG